MGSMCARFRSAAAASILVCSLFPGCTDDEPIAQRVRDNLAEGRREHAISLLRASLDANPDQPDLQYLYGSVLVQQGDHQLAVWPLRRAIQSEEYAVGAGMLLARSLMAVRSATEAAAAASAVLEIEPDLTAALDVRAHALIQLKDEEAALADLDRILELAPSLINPRMTKVIAYLQQGKEGEAEAEATLDDLRKRLEEGDHPENLRARYCVVEAVFTRERGQEEEGRRALEECLEEYPASPDVLREVVTLYQEAGERDAMIAALRGAIEARPQDLSFREGLARVLSQGGDAAAAEEVLVTATEAQEISAPSAWMALYEFYWRSERWAEAKNALEALLDAVPGEAPTTLRIMHIDALIQVGEFARAEEIAADLDEGYKEIMQGRMLLATGDPERALELLQKGIRLWPSNSTARWLAGQCEERLGNLSGALEQYLEGWRIEEATKQADRSDVGLRLGRLHGAAGSLQTAFEFTTSHLEHHPNDVDGLEFAARLTGGLANPAVSAAILGRLSRLPGQAARAEILHAEIADTRRPGTGREVLEGTELDLMEPANVDALEALVTYLLDARAFDQAGEMLDRALSAHPDAASFYALKGVLLARIEQDGESRVAFERALALDESEPRALLGMARRFAEELQLDQALKLYERAARSDGFGSHARLAAADLLATRPERRAESLLMLETLLYDEPLFMPAATLMARLMLEDGVDLERAQDLASRSASYGGGLEGLFVLVDIQRARGDLGAAVVSLEQVSGLPGAPPIVSYRLGLARLSAGDPDGAAKAFRIALDGGDFPEAESARRELAALVQQEAGTADE
jgi:tetratricopeptide (TPR) repeat protein